MQWETIENYQSRFYGMTTQRVSVPGGWLVRTVMHRQQPDDPSTYPQNEARFSQGAGLTFVPDPGHTWQV